MIKKDEIQNPFSCFNRAEPLERIFVLLGRDKATPVAIRSWVRERLRIGKNVSSDVQITEALATADQIEKELQR